MLYRAGFLRSLVMNLYRSPRYQDCAHSTGQPVEYAQSWYRGDRYKFITRLRRTPPL